MRSTVATASVLAIYAAMLSWTPNRESDPFWHMGLARSVLEAGSRVVSEPWSFVAGDAGRAVPEWGFGVALLGAYDLAGWQAISVLVAVFSALAAVIVVIVVRGTATDEPAPGATLVVATIVVSILSGRFAARPEIVAFSFAGIMVLVARQWPLSRGRRRVAIGCAALLTEVVWAQVHGSFVLALPLFVVFGFLSQSWTVVRRSDLLLALALIAGLTTSAWGVDIHAYVLSHASGDAVRHIADMKRSTWATLNPFAHVYAGLWWLLIALGVVGMLWTRVVFVPELLLMFLGAALAADAARFFSMAGLLAGPLAARGASALLAGRRRADWVAILCSVAVAGWTIRETDALKGPIGAGGLDNEGFPFASAARLAKEQPGLRVLSAYEAGAPLGFWLAGRISTWVDSRTPLHFDDTEFALSRDARFAPGALKRAALRYRAGGVVIQRNSDICREVAESWTVVAVDPVWTTFLAAGPPPLRGLLPCGADYVATDACQDGVWPEVQESLSAPESAAFLQYLTAEQSDLCAAASGQMAGTDDPPAGPRAAWGAARDRLVARRMLARGDVDGAIMLLAPSITRGSVASLSIVAPRLFTPTVHPRARGLLEALVFALDDKAPPDIRADLAWICTQQGDVACARFQGLRAAVGGSARAAEVLQWLAVNDPSPAFRAEAEAWSRVPAAAPSDP